VSEDRRRQNLIRATVALIVALAAMVLAPFLPSSALGAVVVVMLVFSVSAIVFFVMARPTRSEVSPAYRGRLSPRQRTATIWGAVAVVFVIASVVSMIKRH
jgi:hypothetical protein